MIAAGLCNMPHSMDYNWHSLLWNGSNHFAMEPGWLSQQVATLLGEASSKQYESRCTASHTCLHRWYPRVPMSIVCNFNLQRAVLDAGPTGRCVQGWDGVVAKPEATPVGPSEEPRKKEL